MKPINSWLTLLLCSILLFSCRHEAPNDNWKKLPKDQRIALLAEQEIEMTKNPITGEVPKDKLHKIRKQLADQNDSREDDIRWEARGPNNVGGRTRGVLIDARDETNNTLFTGSVSGGLWKVTQALTPGPVWERIESFTGNPSIAAITQNPENLDEIYVGTGEGWFNGDAYRGDGVYKSIDGGVTWERLTSLNVTYVQKLLFNNENELLACTRSRGVVKSTDDGETWFEVLSNSNQGFSDRAADLEMTSDGTIYAAMGIFTQDGIYRSDDNGNTWNYLEVPVDSFERIEIATSDANPNLIMAMFQDEDSRDVSAILKSIDKGETWESLPVPGAFGMDNFVRGQGWYDMSMTIDPNDANNIFIGGIDILKSVNGGQTWTQISQWFGGGGFQEVHADQHSAQFAKGSSTVAFFSNDGGLYSTTNADSFFPTVRSLEGNYITTQFYACDIHPEKERNYYIAGAQDNGTNVLNKQGISDADEVVGGDGAFCHIDQIDPNIQIAATQRGRYRITTNSWSSSISLSPNENSFFINPSTYDSNSKIFYASYISGKYVYIDVLSSTLDSVSIDALNDQRVSALATHPTLDNVLFLGTNQGEVIRVLDAAGDNPTASTLFQGSGFTRSIEVDPNYPNRIIITYSNFGVQSVYYSDDAGANWMNLEGDLPDMPVRWGIFNPSNINEAIIATEVGIWRSDITEAPNNTWEFVSGDIGTCRVNMLKFRTSDEQFVAATYGKGLYTTNDFARVGVSFNSSMISINEEAEESSDECGGFTEVDVEVSINETFDIDVTVNLEVNDNSTAIEGIDFDISESTINIPAGEDIAIVTLTVYDDAQVDGDKEVIIDMTASIEVITPRLTVTLIDDDRSFEVGDGGVTDVQLNDEMEFDESVFNGFWHDHKAQFVYRRDILEGIGLNKTDINALSFFVLGTGSSIPYSNFSIRLAHTSQDELSNFVDVSDGVDVYSGDVSPVEGENMLSFDQPFSYNGQDNLLVQICFDNEDYTATDITSATGVDYAATIVRFEDGSAGCGFSDAFETRTTLPNLRFQGSKQFFLYEGERIFSSPLNQDETAYFQENNEVAAKIICTNCDTEDCVSAAVSNGDNTIISQGMNSWSGRIYSITNEIGSNEIESNLYFLDSELEDWFDDNVEIRYTPEAYNGTVDASWQEVEISSTDLLGELRIITFNHQGSGTYALAKIGVVSTADIEDEFVYDEIKYFNILGQEVRNLDETSSVGILIKSYFLKGEILKSEKVLSINN